MINKKGTSVIWGFVIIFTSLLMAIFLGITVFTFNTVNDVLRQDVDMGQVNLRNISDATFGQINTGMLNNADTIGVILLFGMVLLMIFSGFFLGRNNPKIFFIVDMFILVLFFIPAIYVSQVYETFINSTSLLSDVFTNTISKTSKFMLNLPIIIASAGILTMILTYTRVRKRGDEQGGDGSNISGF